MFSLASWLAAQRVRRVVFIAGFFPLPFLGLLSAATVVMAAELRGPRDALIDCGLALLLLAGMAFAVGMDVRLLAASAVLSWLVWLVLGSVAGWSGSLQLAMQAAVLLAVSALIVLLVAVDDATGYWTGILEALYADLAEQGVAVEANIADQAAVMSGVVVSGSFVGSAVALLLGSSWASAVQQGDFAAQFRGLRLGYVIGVLAALAGVAQILGVDTGGALLLFGAAFMFHGMGVLGWWANQLGWPRGWWIGLCILTLLLPNLLIIVLVVFSAAGFIDNWYSLRRKSA